MRLKSLILNLDLSVRHTQTHKNTMTEATTKASGVETEAEAVKILPRGEVVHQGTTSLACAQRNGQSDQFKMGIKC